MRFLLTLGSNSEGSSPAGSVKDTCNGISATVILGLVLLMFLKVGRLSSTKPMYMLAMLLAVRSVATAVPSRSVSLLDRNSGGKFNTGISHSMLSVAFSWQSCAHITNSFSWLLSVLQESRAIERRTARFRCKFWYVHVLKFTAASRGFRCDSTSFKLNNSINHTKVANKIVVVVNHERKTTLIFLSGQIQPYKRTYLEAEKRRVATDLRQHFVTERVINGWNYLDSSVQEAGTLNTFISKLQKLYNKDQSFLGATCSLDSGSWASSPWEASTRELVSYI